MYKRQILFCAPLLARLGRVSTVLPGGCRIGARPIDLRLQGLAQMGVRQLPAAPGQLTLYAPAGLRGAEICQMCIRDSTSTLSGLAVAMQAYADKQEEPAA